jgi:DNA-binding MarR family transcriptional regulator/N-acetylglutamate synthase-like GNAT family acetyltransferase
MEKSQFIAQLRQASRKLVRELGMLQLTDEKLGRTPPHWHALVEIYTQPGINVSEVSILLLLSKAATSRIIDTLINNGLVYYEEALDKRKKRLFVTEKGKAEITRIDEFSNVRAKAALHFLDKQDQKLILKAIKKYAKALELSREKKDTVKILKLSTSRLIRKKIISMIEKIQIDEFKIPITEEINACILKPEEHFIYKNECNFWYAASDNGKIIGSIGLKMIDMNSAEIKKFFVHNNYRNHGVAWQLFNKLVKAAEKHKFNKLYLGTVDKLKAAQRYYEKRGFKVISKDSLPQGFDTCPLDTVFLAGSLADVKSTL